MITLIVAYKNLAVPSTISDEMKARIAQNKRIALAKKQQKLQLPQASDAQAVQASDAQAVSTLIGIMSIIVYSSFFSIISFLSSPLNISFWRHSHLNSSVRIFFFFLYFFLFSFFFFPP